MTSAPLNLQDTNQKNLKNEHRSSLLSLAITAIVLFVIVFLLRSYIIKPFIVNGVSMYPTLNTFNYLLIDKATYNFKREPERGEVVVFKAPMYTDRYFIKRVIGLPGETVRIDGQKVQITTSELPSKTFILNEPYIIDSKRKDSNINITLKNDEYYMLGDNRLESADSRYWGPLKRNRIEGRALVRLFPLNKIDWLPGDYEYNNN